MASGPQILVRSPLKLMISVGFAAAAGFIGTVFTVTGPGSWYEVLQKPWFTPPGWVFAIVWTLLYFLMGFAFYLVWMEAGHGKDIDMAVFAFFAQLVVNALWSYLFFGLEMPLFGLTGVVILWFMIAITLYVFRQVSRAAALLLVPYLIWVTFAGILNYWILVMNP
jgi:tryptophan-rich sensory protein